MLFTLARGRRLRALAVLSSCLLAGAALAEDPSSPLDPLSPAELQVAADLIRADSRFPQKAFFHLLATKEPPKSEVLVHAPGQPFPREALGLVSDRSSNATFEVWVDLVAKRVTKFEARSGFQAPFIPEEFELLSQIAGGDPGWQSALKRRGIDRPEDVSLDGWYASTGAPAQLRNHRLMLAVPYLQGKARNYYGRPIEGLSAWVDLTQGKVLEVLDREVVPIAPPAQEFDAKSLGPPRGDLKPLTAASPDGPSFTVQGHEVRWQGWRFRFAVHPRDGLVLYRVGFEDQGRWREILYRASLSEMVVPYGDPDPGWSWRSAFDADQYGLGRTLASLKPGADTPTNAVFFDWAFVDGSGKAREKKNVVALYERYGGTLWKRGREARPSRDLVIYASAAVGNYDYGFSWVFHQDGSLDLDVGLTGIMLAKGVAEASHDGGHSMPNGHLVAPFLIAPHHQHFMSFRLDFDLDGPANTVMEMSVRREAGGIRMEERRLESERQARRELDFNSARKWKVINAEVKNPLGDPSGYILIPGENAIPYLADNAPARRRAGFLSHHLWVTRYKPDELHASGEFPSPEAAGDGVERWSSDDERLAQTDLVLWYTLGVTHTPRPEEWPVMPVTHAGFRLVPAGFFNHNPVLDVPPGP